MINMTEPRAKALWTQLNGIIPVECVIDVDMVGGEWEVVIW